MPEQPKIPFKRAPKEVPKPRPPPEWSESQRERIQKEEKELARAMSIIQKAQEHIVAAPGGKGDPAAAHAAMRELEQLYPPSEEEEEARLQLQEEAKSRAFRATQRRKHANLVRWQGVAGITLALVLGVLWFTSPDPWYHWRAFGFGSAVLLALYGVVNPVLQRRVAKLSLAPAKGKVKK